MIDADKIRNAFHARRRAGMHAWNEESVIDEIVAAVNAELEALRAEVAALRATVECPSCIGVCSETLTRHTCGRGYEDE